jgi:UDP-N-acetylglucosamine 2-epimerase
MHEASKKLIILSVLGTRPEAIKMAPVINELAKHGDTCRSLVCVTAQHRQMLDQVLDLFHIKPAYDLNIMQPDQALSQLTAELFSNLDPVVRDANPDWILAQGDTATVLVASLVAFYNRIPFGHVEAGLRTGDLDQPFPEEMNRRVADCTARLLFAPTARNRQNLICEGYNQNRVVVTGNTVIDALVSVGERPYDWSSGPLSTIPEHKKIILVTAHRRENFGQRLREISLAIKEIALQFESQAIHIVYPVHMNPNVRAPVNEILRGIPNVSLTEPLDYLSLVHVMKRSLLILTDSGGIQEEAPSFGVPVLVMRKTTERPEGVEAGVLKIVGTQKDRIVRETERLLTEPSAYREMAKGINPYGDGRAAKRIVSTLLEHPRK